MKKVIFSVCVLFACSFSALAQTEIPKYQRSSLHMILLTTTEATLEGGIDFTAELDKSWQNYPFPDKYDRLSIATTQAYGGAPKGSLIELVNKYQNGVNNLGIEEATQILNTIKNGQEYNDCLVSAINELIETEKIGNQLIRQWFNIQDDGSYDNNLIKERANYNANQAAIAEANATSRGVQAIIDQGANLISNTFVTFSKLCFYESEPVAAFSRDIAYVIADLTAQNAGAAGSIAQMAAKAAADIAYNATKDGYTARTTTALYKLDWNDEIKATFYQMFTADGKVDMAAFNNYTFTMSLVGIDAANSTTIDALGGLASMVGVDKSKPKYELIEQTIVRNIDKIIAKMQKNYEVFAPVSQIISVNPLMADMGKKEGLEGGEAFNLMEPVYNEKTNEIEWKTVGTVKVDKKQIWDNRYSLIEGTNNADEVGLKGTVLSANKKAAVGMVVKQVSKAKK